MKQKNWQMWNSRKCESHSLDDAPAASLTNTRRSYLHTYSIQTQQNQIWLLSIILGIVFLFISLDGCASATVTPIAIPLNTATPSPSVAAPMTRAKSTSKLSTRLETLTQSPALRTANEEEQAHALSLPVHGPGSLVRDAQHRVLVDIRVTDLSTTGLQALSNSGAIIATISERYQVVSAFVAIPDLVVIANLPTVQSVQERLTPSAGGGAILPTPS